MGRRTDGRSIPGDVQLISYPGQTPLKEYVAMQLSMRLGKLAQEAARAAKTQDEEAIHDLRVSIRRFAQGLILFPKLLPAEPVKSIRKQLRKVMKLTNELRNRDITLEHLGKSADESTKQQLLHDREIHAAEFRRIIAEFPPTVSAGQWIAELEL